MASVQRRLPGPGFNLDQLRTMFAEHGLDTTDLVALSGTPFVPCYLHFSISVVNFGLIFSKIKLVF